MDSSVKSACFDEISHTILDADKKLTVKSLSNNWDITIKEAAAILDEWISKNTKHKLSKEYLIKGTDKNGNGVITVVPDTKLDIIQKKLENFSQILHSIELVSDSSCKKLIVPEYDEIKMINLQIDSEERDFDASSVVLDEPVATKSQKIKIQPTIETKKEVSISSMFSSSGISDKKSMIDIDSEESKVDSSPSDVIKSSASPKKELRTPKKSEESAKIKESPKAKKDAKKAPSKNSIASFFIQAGSKPKPAATTTVSASQSAKPASPKRIKPEVKPPESAKEPEPKKKPEKKSPEKISSKPTKSEMVTPKKKESKTDSLKRSISAICDSEDSDDDIIPTTPQSKKQPSKARRAKPKQNSKAKKRSRIIQNESSDEDDGPPLKKGGKSSDIENMEVVESSPEIKSNKSTQNGNNSNGKRRKAKRTVTRTYEDSDGFFKTVKEVEEYSCSDDDIEVTSKTPVKQHMKNKPAADTKKSPTKRSPTKKIEKPATKQGSIMSFFTKK